MSFQMIAFWAMAALIVVPATLIVFEKSIVRAAFWLLGTLMGVAGFYVLLGADFLGFTQVMVYIGGINVLLLFGIMLTHRDPVFIKRPQTRVSTTPALILAAVVLFTLVAGILGTKWSEVAVDKAAEPTAARLGTALMSEYVLPFEIISILLLVVLVGSAYLARRSPPQGRP